MVVQLNARLRLALAVLGLMSLSSVTGAAEVEASVPAVALFEGRRIVLADGWGEASACLVFESGGVLECFRTEAELDVRLGTLQGGIADDVADEGSGGAALLVATCSTSLRLYDGTSYGSPGPRHCRPFRMGEPGELRLRQPHLLLQGGSLRLLPGRLQLRGWVVVSHLIDRGRGFFPVDDLWVERSGLLRLPQLTYT
jgi:hypothetical protein